MCRVFCCQIKFQPNDHGEIKDLADEIKNFEGIRHESLVKYYGVELHRVSNHVLISGSYNNKTKINNINFYFTPELEMTIL